jgi:hypothetical protein
VWFKHRAWIPIAWILSVLNIAAVWFAAAPGEAWHATVHALLGAGFALGAQRLTVRRRALQAVGDDTKLRAGLDAFRQELGTLGQPLGEDRLKRLEQAVDSIAVELERVGEGQRYMTKLMAERDPQTDRSRRTS